MKQFTRVPVIIGGCGRSGTTLLLSILDAFSSVFAIPEESRFFCPGAYEYTLQAGESHPVTREELYHQRKRNMTEKKSIDLPLFYAYLEGYDIPGECTRWCEKTPKNVLFFSEILDLFGEDVRIIHIIRDGRDVVTSVHPGRAGEYHIPFQRWIDEVSTGLLVRHDPRVLTVRYEELTDNFQHILKSIGRFIGEDVTPRELNWFFHTGVRNHDSWEDTRLRPLDGSSVGRWRLPAHHRRVQDFLKYPGAAGLLKELGYGD